MSSCRTGIYFSLDEKSKQKNQEKNILSARQAAIRPFFHTARGLIFKNRLPSSMLTRYYKKGFPFYINACNGALYKFLPIRYAIGIY